MPILPRAAGLAASALPLVPALLAASEGAGVASTRDPVSQGLVGAILVGVFVLLARETAHRVLVVIAAVALLWGITYLTPFKLIGFEASAAALDLNVLLLLAGMMAIVGVLKTTGAFDSAVGRLLERGAGHPVRLAQLMIAFTAVMSAFMDNVTTVVFVTPMALAMARELGIRPVAFLLPVVMASNIGGTATLIGDPPNIMIGSGAGLSFLDFVENLTVPCVYIMLVLDWFMRRRFGSDLAAARPVAADLAVPPLQDPRLFRWAAALTGGVFVGFLTHGLTGMPAAVPAVLGAAAILIVQDVLYLRTNRPSAHERQHGMLHVIEREIEWPTLCFFAFLFIAVGAAVQTGLIDTIAQGLSAVIRRGSATLGLGDEGTVFFAAFLILWTSGFLSAIIDNIPFVAVAIPIVHQLIGELPGQPEALWWALALGACLGGNGSAVGASANVTVIGLAEKAGTRITFGEFARFGAPVMVLSLLVSSAYLALEIHLDRDRALGIELAGLAVLALGLALRGRLRGRTA